MGLAAVATAGNRQQAGGGEQPAGRVCLHSADRHPASDQFLLRPTTRVSKRSEHLADITRSGSGRRAWCSSRPQTSRSRPPCGNGCRARCGAGGYTKSITSSPFRSADTISWLVPANGSSGAMAWNWPLHVVTVDERRLGGQRAASHHNQVCAAVAVDVVHSRLGGRCTGARRPRCAPAWWNADFPSR